MARLATRKHPSLLVRRAAATAVLALATSPSYAVHCFSPLLPSSFSAPTTIGNGHRRRTAATTGRNSYNSFSNFFQELRGGSSTGTHTTVRSSSRSGATVGSSPGSFPARNLVKRWMSSSSATTSTTTSGTETATSTTATTTPSRNDDDDDEDHIMGTMTPAEKLQALRKKMKELNLDVYVVPTDDPHLSGTC